MRTLVISDLHLGAIKGTDLLRHPDVRAPLLQAVADVERLVLLGDTLELRESPLRDAPEIGGPFFSDLGQALGPDGELLVLAGNHDHGLIAGWIDGRLQTEPPGFLGLEQRIEPKDSGPLAATLAKAARPARMTLAYPGVWLRDDVYALHGHYADLHATVPTFERLVAGAMARWIVHLPDHDATPDHYEAALSPMYAWLHELAQRSNHALVRTTTGASGRAWVALVGNGRRRRPLRAAALGAGYAAGVAAINRIGLGPVRRDLSGQALRQGYLHGITEALRRLGVSAPYVVWGHSHRAGPQAGDDLAEWSTPAGTRILNTGSWVYQPHFMGGGPRRSPYWPGTGVLLEDDAPPRLVQLLDATPGVKHVA